MSIQSLLTEGRQDSGLLEKIADYTLAFPRAMWLGRKITITGSGESPFIDHKRNKFYKFISDSLEIASRPGSSGCFGAGLLLLSPIYLAATTLALPLLCVGLALKEISILTDEKAKQYQSLIDKATIQINLNKENDRLHKKIPILASEFKKLEDTYQEKAKERIEGTEQLNTQMEKLARKIKTNEEQLSVVQTDLNTIFEAYKNQ